MNQNYVRKCEEYLQNMPPQNEAHPSVRRQQRVESGSVNQRLITTAAVNKGKRYPASRKTAQQPEPFGGEKQSINNPVPIGVDSKGSVWKVKGKTLSNPGQQEKQPGSKYVRPCCRPPPHQQKRVLVDRVPCARPNLSVGGCPQKASDNVNQSDNEKPLETHPIEQPTKRYYEYGSVEDGQRQQNAKSVTTGSWDGILTSTGTGMSLSQIKSKNASHHSAVPAEVPPGLQSTSASSSSSSAAPSYSTTRPNSSIVAVPPQPRRSAATPQPSRPNVMCKSSELDTDGINLFRFDPLRTLQFLTLELKSKLKALDSSTSDSPELKQLYKISKEVLLAVKILTESWNVNQKLTGNCKRCEKLKMHQSDVNHVSINSQDTIGVRCKSCDNLRNELDRQSAHHSEQTELLNEEINYLKAKLMTPANNGDSTKHQSREQPEPESCLPNPTLPPTDLELQKWLEGEIKRLQTMISDKQTLQDGLIDDLNRKLQEATSRCRHLELARNESEKRLLYATLENERLNFLLNTQASTMTTLKSDFRAIETLAHQQIDLFQDRTQSPSNAGHTSATRSPIGDNKASNPINTTIIDNHHCNYRQPSSAIPSTSRFSSGTPSGDSDDGDSNRNQQPFSSPGWQQQSSNADTTTITSSRKSSQEKLDACMGAEKLRKQRRHYGFKNIAEKESDDGNDANDLLASLPSSSSRSMTALSEALKTTKVLGDNTLDATATAFRRKPDDHLMNVQEEADAAAIAGNDGRNGSYFKSTALAQTSAPHEKLSSSKSMSAIECVRSKPVRRTILIDSDCELSLPEPERPFSKAGVDVNQNYAVTDFPVPEAKKRFPLSAKGMTKGKTIDGKNDSSKTNNDCARLSFRPEQQQHHQHLPPPGLERLMASVAGKPSFPKGNGKKDNDNGAGATMEEKYPRDYGDKFERRESCLLRLPFSPERELCQNRPIIGQIRQSGRSAGEKAPKGTSAM
ncbi:uncharacterized protein LOC5578848 [Aedes aegypti]|uniref:Uncharacterized protein n=1 Tax=Aedes aegypti TaxID=7159 RepID=A0A903UXM4_AEDAE|nr:uncharacterized protein LOC5578848 [Aedes aegypti]